MLGGWIAGLFGLDVFTGLGDPLAWVAAIGGSIVVLLIWGLIFGRRKR